MALQFDRYKQTKDPLPGEPYIDNNHRLIVGTSIGEKEVAYLEDISLNTGITQQQLDSAISAESLARQQADQALTQALNAIALTPGPKGDKGDPGATEFSGLSGQITDEQIPAIITRDSELQQAVSLLIPKALFHYYGPGIPTSPADGQTWRETTSSGLLINDWVWSGLLSRWLSLQADNAPGFVSVAATQSPNLALWASPGTWAYRVEWYFIQGNFTASNRWTASINVGRNAGSFVSTEIANFSINSNAVFSGNTSLFLAENAVFLFATLTRVGTAPALTGAISTSRHRVR